MNAPHSEQSGRKATNSAGRQFWQALRGHFFMAAIVSFVAVAGTGCKVAAPHQTIENAVHSRADLAVTEQQVRIRMRALVEPLCGALVESADQIMAATTNRAVRREALVWKIEAVPAMREALFRPNPFVATMDTWVLTWQMRDYFESGPGRAAMGDAAPVAVKTCEALANEVETVAASLAISGDVSDARKFARDWAREHPIQHSIGSRESTVSRVTERQLQEAFSTQEIAGNVLVTLDDLNRRMDVYSVQLFDQARWQAELFTMDQTAALGVDQAMPLAEHAVRSADRAVAVVEQLAPALQDSLTVVTQAPSLVTAEREATIAAVHAEVTNIINFIQEQRVATMKQVAGERAAAVRDIGETVEAEHHALVAEMDRMSLKVVDHAFWRAAQLLAVCGVVVFVGVLILLMLVRRWFSNPKSPT